jgi:hypothetical protein
MATNNPFKDLNTGGLHDRLGIDKNSKNAKEDLATDVDKIIKGKVGDTITTTAGKKITINDHDKKMAQFAKNMKG